MQETTNLKLRKPGYVDPADIMDHNHNYDIIDSSIHTLNEEVLVKMARAVKAMDSKKLAEHFVSKLNAPLDAQISGSMTLNLIPPFTAKGWIRPSGVVVQSKDVLVNDASQGYNSAYVEFPIEPDTAYTLRCTVQGGDGGNKYGYLHLFQKNAEGTDVDTTGAPNNQATTDILYTFTSHPNARKVKMFFTNYGDGHFVYAYPQLVKGTFNKSTIPPYGTGCSPLEHPMIEIRNNNWLDRSNVEIGWLDYNTGAKILGGNVDLRTREKIPVAGGETIYVKAFKDGTEFTAASEHRSFIFEYNKDGYFIGYKDFTQLGLKLKDDTRWIHCAFLATTDLDMDFVVSTENLTAPVEAKKGVAILPTYLAEVYDRKDRVIKIEGDIAYIQRFIGRRKIEARWGWGMPATARQNESCYIYASDIAADAHNTVYTPGAYKLKRFDGMLIPGVSNSDDLYAIPNTAWFGRIVGGTHDINDLYLNVTPDITGWGGSYTPTEAERGAFIYGWKMKNRDTGQPFTGAAGEIKAWERLLDGNGTTESLPTAPVPGFTPYEIFYWLAEPVIEEVKLITPPDFDGLSVTAGNNIVAIRDGFVFERANIQENPNGGEWAFNLVNHPNYGKVNSPQSFRVKEFRKIYKLKNGVWSDAMGDWIHYTVTSMYGSDAYYSNVTHGFDPSAEYFVFYEMEVDYYSSRVIDASISYAQNAHDVRNDLVEDLQALKGDVGALAQLITDTCVKGDDKRLQVTGAVHSGSLAPGVMSPVTVTFNTLFKDIPAVFAVLSEAGGTSAIVVQVPASWVTTATATVFFTNTHPSATCSSCSATIFAIGQ